MPPGSGWIQGDSRRVRLPPRHGACVGIYPEGSSPLNSVAISAAMAISTRITEILRIQHPVLLAPMDLVADARLAAEVSRAGGLGLIG